MNQIKIVSDQGRFDFELPTHWDEVPAHLYPSLARIYLRDTCYMRDTDKLVRALSVLVDDALGAVLTLSEEQQLQLCSLVGWVWSDMTLRKNLIPEFELEGLTYYGPAGDFSNIRFGEFVMAETYFAQYVESSLCNVGVLDKLIAVLYRQAGEGYDYVVGSATYRGDIRQKFNSNIIDHHAKLISKLDVAVKDGIYLWYMVTRESFFKYFKHIFNKRMSSEIKSNGTVQWGWFGVFDDLLGEKGRTAESLEDEFVSVTLMSLDRAQEKVKESKRKK